MATPDSGAPSSGRAYLYKVALNEWRRCAGRDRRRRESLTRLGSSELSGEDSIGPLRSLEELERQRAVWLAIERLPTPQREVFLLHRFEGLSCCQIADVQGEKRKTVESRLRLALLKLTETLRLQEDRL
ncbi:MAG: RNA polymerase sigma factor [Planctomycetota bacterium]